jgi:hypothetical protein
MQDANPNIPSQFKNVLMQNKTQILSSNQVSLQTSSYGLVASFTLLVDTSDVLIGQPLI